jgi:Zn-finger nucleic acid-binding protein
MPDEKKRDSKKPGDAPKGERPRKPEGGDERPKKKAPAAPEPVAKATRPAKTTSKIHGCPRCGVSLQGTKYEGVAVEFCDTCWGYWVGRLELETILTSKDETFGREEKKSVSRAPAHEGDRKLLTCVRCEKHMSKMAVEDDGMVAFLVDYCRDHGLWLDTGEIKRAQVLDERTGAVRKALRSSFDRAAVEADEESGS